MIYFIYWLILIKIIPTHGALAISALITLYLAPKRQRRALFYTLPIAAALLYCQPIWTNPQLANMPTQLSGFVYQVDDHKADFYTDYGLFKLSCRQLNAVHNGQYVTISNATQRQQANINRHGFNYLRHYHTRGYRDYIEGDMLRAVDRRDPFVYRRISAWLQRYISQTAKRLSPAAALLCDSLLLGKLPDGDFSDDILGLGILHLFVISGFHFTIIIGVMLWLFNHLFRLPYRWASVLIIAFCLCYFGAIKGGYGADRAMLLCLLAVLVFALKLRGDPVQLVLLYAGLQLAINADALYSLGFQLTCGATLTVALASRATRQIGMMSKTLQALLISGAVYLVISAALLLSKGAVPLVGVLLAPLLTPLISSFLTLMIIVLLLAPILSWTPLNWLIDQLANAIIGWIEWASPLQAFRWQIMPQWGVVLASLLGCLALAYLLRNRRWSLINALALGLSLSAIILIGAVDEGLTINAYALYDGESYLIRAPGAVIMYDVGNDDTIVHLLKSAGVTHIDAIIISHAHQDHIGALPLILDSFTVDHVITTCLNGESLTIGSISLTLYQAPAELWQDYNDSSIACHINYQQIDMLMTGDMESAALGWLSAQHHATIDILKVPHHGSDNDNFYAALQQYQPQVALIAGGYGKGINKMPIVEDLLKTKTLFYDTILEGEIHIQSDGTALTITKAGAW